MTVGGNCSRQKRGEHLKSTKDSKKPRTFLLWKHQITMLHHFKINRICPFWGYGILVLIPLTTLMCAPVSGLLMCQTQLDCMTLQHTWQTMYSLNKCTLNNVGVHLLSTSETEEHKNITELSQVHWATGKTPSSKKTDADQVLLRTYCQICLILVASGYSLYTNL